MPNVPNVPGVPTLASYSSSGLPSFLIADVIAATNAFLAPSIWGVFRNGVPVIIPAIRGLQTFTATVTSLVAPLQSIASFLGAPNVLPVVASTIEFEYAQDWPISDYTQEQGAFQSYNKVSLPFDVKMMLAAGGPPAARQAFIDTCLGIGNSLDLFDVVTPEKVFTSCNVTHVDWRRGPRRGVSLIHIDMWFKQVNVGAAASFANTLSPTVAGQQAVGAVQPLPADTTTQTTVTNAFGKPGGF